MREAGLRAASLALATLVACAEEAEPTPEVIEEAPLDFRFPVEEPIVHDPSPVELPGGLVARCLEPGEGRRAVNGDRLCIHYVTHLAEGEQEVDSTYVTGIPFTFTLGAGELIPGLERGLVGARGGSKHRLDVPASLAYGAEGCGRIPPDADLVYLVDVMRIE